MLHQPNVLISGSLLMKLFIRCTVVRFMSRDAFRGTLDASKQLTNSHIFNECVSWCPWLNSAELCRLLQQCWTTRVVFRVVMMKVKNIWKLPSIIFNAKKKIIDHITDRVCETIFHRRLFAWSLKTKWKLCCKNCWLAPVDTMPYCLYSQSQVILVRKSSTK